MLPGWFVKLLWLFPTLEGWSHESESRTCWHQSHKIKSLGKPDIENYTDLLLLQLLMLVRPQCRWPILWMEISEDVPGIHKHKQECCLSHGHMNNDESTPAGECGLLQPMKEEPAIIDSQDSSVGQDIMNSFSLRDSFHARHGYSIELFRAIKGSSLWTHYREIWMCNVWKE